MHERSLAENIIRIVRDKLPERTPLPRVTEVALEVGEMQQVVPDALRFYFDELTRGSNLEGAELQIVVHPLGGECKRCHAAVSFDSPPYVCLNCGSDELRMGTGFELDVVSVEIEDRT